MLDKINDQDQPSPSTRSPHAPRAVHPKAVASRFAARIDLCQFWTARRAAR